MPVTTQSQTHKTTIKLCKDSQCPQSVTNSYAGHTEFPRRDSGSVVINILVLNVKLLWPHFLGRMSKLRVLL